MPLEHPKGDVRGTETDPSPHFDIINVIHTTMPHLAFLAHVRDDVQRSVVKWLFMKLKCNHTHHMSE